MAEVAYVNASRIYPGTPPVRAVDRLSLDIDDGEFLVLVGPSGSGKSTALRMLAGLEETNEGSIRIGGVDVTGKPPKARDIAMVFQSYALYPHMTVAENMGFALKLRRMPKDVIQQKVTEAAKMLGLEKYLDRKPKALSGGQRQRVAMGRAIVREPSVFLMDEPLSNLDAKLRVETRANIASLQQRLGTTTVYVTHDQVEAMTMGHRVAVLKDGVLQQCASPRELYQRPANTFVAGFIGSPAMNLKQVPLRGDSVQLGEQVVPLPRNVELGPGSTGEVIFGVRPESLRLVPESEPGLEMTVELVEDLGADSLVHGSVEVGGSRQRLVLRTDGRTSPALGERIRVAVRDFEEVHLFHPESGQRLAA
ncbi:ABC transporter ATP-binding protein [Saccharopolyspora rectivirgula]|jgi:multiple sugar transport system ATP-binding protein|uniref:Sugar ABC transporter ATP-binding protein n=1 Tax=Saccharopolyspora rectivirgula TaxID=28042 RepID=A0A073B742_9PSEU|nr:sn-glycerol-3-phosphate ABC transporter ATP-binding protein UgpC [Saccharopolyspora rectivirgula]KEI43494.1 sugar ABC transporter ATP-binding protein [Saccharopolyspora rectivirgula]